MSRPASRRGVILSIAALPIAGSAAAATPAITPKLARLIAKHDRINDRLNGIDPDECPYDPGLMQAAGALRARVAGYPSRGLPDILAKAACLGRLWPMADLEAEVRDTVDNRYACLDDMAEALVAELIRFGEGAPCA